MWSWLGACGRVQKRCEERAAWAVLDVAAPQGIHRQGPLQLKEGKEKRLTESGLEGVVGKKLLFCGSGGEGHVSARASGRPVPLRALLAALGGM